MEREKETRCVKCGAVIGRWIYAGSSNSPLGAIGIYDQELYDNASHCYYRIGRKRGTLCKDCANEIFKEGFRYYVVITSGVYNNQIVGDAYTDEESAQATADEMNAKHLGCSYGTIKKAI